VDVVDSQCNINQSRTRSILSQANQRNIRSSINVVWVDRCDIDALEVAIHEWFAFSNVVSSSGLTGIKDIAKSIANISAPQTQLVREPMSKCFVVHPIEQVGRVCIKPLAAIAAGYINDSLEWQIHQL